jgi:hypothetical protein
MRIYPVVKKVIQGGGGGISDAFGLGINIGDSNVAPTDAATYAMALAQAETNATPTETTNLSLPAPDFADLNPAPTEARTLVLRYWATGCTTNDVASGNTVTPANANGQNDGVFAHCKTGTGTGDTTNPVTVTTGSLNVPGGLTILSASVMVWFKAPAITGASTDTLFLRITASGGVNQHVWDGPASSTLNWPGVDHSASPLVFDVSTYTLAQMQSIALNGSYNATVVLAPQTSLEIDAWAVAVTASL